MAIVGIDLGTTNSLIGRMEKGKPLLFKNADGSTLVPSIVAYLPAKTLAGIEAREQLSQHPDRTFFSVKRFMGLGKNDLNQAFQSLPFDTSPSDENTIRFKLGDASITPIEVSAQILKKLKNLAQSESNEPVAQAVITVPAYFNDAQRQATKKAAEIAGLTVLRLLNEPTAACLAYGLDKKTQGIIAVYDLGGGTFDISILRVKDGIFEVLATGGDTVLGGDDIDRNILLGLSEPLSKAFSSHWLNSAEGKTQLLKEAESVKKRLSHAPTTLFKIQKDETGFAHEISQQDLAKWIAPILDRTRGICGACIKDAGIAVADIQDVLLVGGSTRTPAVRDFVAGMFKKSPLCSIDPQEVVALGATVQAHLLESRSQELLLLDVLPLSLGIETLGGVTSKILHRNTTVPATQSEYFTTSVDGQTSVDIHVLQGERELVADNRSLARFQLKGIPPLAAGYPKIQVEFTVDVNGILSVRALETRTSTYTSVTVNPSYGITDTEMEGMLESAYENAEEDFEKRFLIEAKLEAENLLRATEKAIPKGKAFITEAQSKNIEKAIAEMKTALSSENRQQIKKSKEYLDAMTQDMAEKLLNEAVQTALKGKSL